jgi:hypothetical protein
MTPEELLKPRYKVIADYPGNIHPIGHIHGHDINGTQNVMKLDEWLAFHDKYPHLFKKLEWWGDREEKDMPLYLRTNKKGEQMFGKGVVYKIRHYSGKGGILDHVRLDNDEAGTLYWFDPATEQEYTEYLNQQTQKP